MQQHNNPLCLQKRRPTTRAQPRFLISTQKNGKLAANYNYNHYNLSFSHIMIIVIISDEDMLLICKEGKEDENVLQAVASFFSGSIIRRHACDGRLY